MILDIQGAMIPRSSAQSECLTSIKYLQMLGDHLAWGIERVLAEFSPSKR